MKKLCLAILAASTFSVEVYAREFADIYTDCGLGAMIAPNNDTVAAITNVTWDLGTTAISSNASSEDACKGGMATTAAIIYQSYPVLEQEIAAGSGEYLSAVLVAAGCETAQASVVQSVRTSLQDISASHSYATNSREKNSELLFNAVQNAADASCKAV